MSDDEDRLIDAKDQLCLALGGESMETYLTNLKLWFRKIWTKEQFDLECRKLLLPEQRHLHNEFFLAILNKITTPLPSEPSIDGAKKRKRRGSERIVFEPTDLYDYLPDEIEEPRVTCANVQQPRFATDELFLPDASLILGRLLVVAWEHGLGTADDEICDMMVLAVQVLLKNIISAVIKSRKNFRTTNSGRYYYDVGCPYKDVSLRNTAIRQIIDDEPLEVDREISSISTRHRTNDDSVYLAACENVHQTLDVNCINVLDLYHTLQDKNLIPCHSVYTNNMERISHMLN